MDIGCLTWCLRVAKHFVCIGDCGMTPFDGGIPTSPHNNVCWKKTKHEIRELEIKCFHHGSFTAGASAQIIQFGLLGPVCPIRSFNRIVVWALTIFYWKVTPSFPFQQKQKLQIRTTAFEAHKKHIQAFQLHFKSRELFQKSAQKRSQEIQGFIIDIVKALRKNNTRKPRRSKS